MSIRRALILPDTHRPFHSVRAYNLMLDIASYIGPIHEIVILGDYADFYSVSRYQKDPRVQQGIIHEVESVLVGLKELNSLFPRAKKIFLEGNHERRLEDYLVQKCPELFGLTRVRDLFELDDLGWKFVPFGRNQSYRILNSDLFAFHRPKASQVKLHVARAGCSTVYGDVHKIEEASAVTHDNRVLTGYCPGWLGDQKQRVFDYCPSTPQWQTGFSIVSVEGQSKTFHKDIIHIKNDKAIVYGKVFKA